MIVQDLLRIAPREALVSYFIPYRFECVKPEDLDRLKSAVASWIQKLTARSIVSSEDYLIGYTSYVENGRNAVCVIKRDDLEKWAASGMETCAPVDDDPASAYPGLPEIYGIFFSDWDRVLSLKVEEHNASEFGVNRFLAEVLRELSFQGFDEADMHAARNELYASLEKQASMTPEEREASCRPADEVFRELAEKFGFEYHEKTAEEKAERARKTEENVRKEYAERYRVMKALARNVGIAERRAR